MSPPSPAVATRRLSTPPSLSGGGGGGVSKKRGSLGAPSGHSRPSPGQQQQFVQLSLDLGQSKFGMVTCADCGMVYSAGNQSDALRHSKFHGGRRAAQASPKSGTWRGQQVAKEFFNGDRIVRVTPADRVGWQRARDIFQLMDMELGQGTDPDTYNGMLVLLYVRHQAGIVGCCIAEPLRLAYRMMPAPQDAEAVALERSTEPLPAQCGIHKIWCRTGHRRSGVATALLDAARANLCLGLHVPLDRVAFTAPTPSGYRLACRYLRTDRPLVY